MPGFYKSNALQLSEREILEKFAEFSDNLLLLSLKDIKDDLLKAKELVRITKDENAKTLYKTHVTMFKRYLDLGLEILKTKMNNKAKRKKLEKAFFQESSKKRLGAFIGGLLTEDVPMPQPANTQAAGPVETPQDASLDQVVDRYIVRYERESIPNVNSYDNQMLTASEGIDFSSHSLVLEYVLNEADDEDPAADTETDDTADAPADDAGGGGLEGLGDLGDAGGDTGGGSEKTNDEPPVSYTPQINLQNFANSMARFINNFDKLLNPKNVILNRVNAYMKNNYDEKTARELMDLLDTNYSLRPDQVEQEQEATGQRDNPESYSVGALAGASGG